MQKQLKNIKVKQREFGQHFKFSFFRQIFFQQYNHKSGILDIVLHNFCP